MLDVIITSSCRNTIIRTLNSFQKSVSYAGNYNYIVNVDVLNRKYLPSLLRYFEKMKITNIHINENPKGFNHSHTKAICYLYGKVNTPVFFHLQDDWIFLKKIELDPLIKLMEKYSYIDHIRFSKEKIKERAWLYYLSDEVSEEYLVPNKQVGIDGISVVQTPTWSFNPSLVRTSVAKKFTNISEGTRAETYICKNYPTMLNHQGTYIFGKIGDSRTVKDTGRNKLINKLRKFKYIITGGKYADYQFGD